MTPTSAPPSTDDTRGTPRVLRHDERAVSEVVGQIMMFGILSILLVLTMLFFRGEVEKTTEEAAAQQAAAFAQRVASVAVEAGLFAERLGPESTFHRTLDAPQDLEGWSYQVVLQYSSGSRPDRVVVRVPDIVHQADPLANCGSAGTPWEHQCFVMSRSWSRPPDSCPYRSVGQPLECAAPLFQAGAHQSVHICETTLWGGDLAVRYGPDPTPPADPLDPPNPPCIFLEAL